MEVQTILLVSLGFIAAAGGSVAYFTRSRGVNTIELLQTNIEAYKDQIKLKDNEIAYLKGQLDIKERTIERLVNDRQSTKS